MPLCGGLGDAKPADDVVHELLQKLKEELRSKVAEKRPTLAASDLPPLVAVAYKTQVVAGTNFFVKVKVAEGDFVHARIYKDLQGNVTLHSITESQTEADDIVHF